LRAQPYEKARQQFRAFFIGGWLMQLFQLRNLRHHPFKSNSALADRFFTDPAAKKEVLQILNRYQLEESAIEAEALRECLEDLERLDKMEALLEMRRNRTLRIIRESRDALAQRAKESSERILERKPSRWLEDSSTKKSAA
jgi:hypothetical protein